MGRLFQKCPLEGLYPLVPALLSLPELLDS